MITKDKLNLLAEKYETRDFIKNDPIQFPHRFSQIEDVEIAAFLASIFAYGNRKLFIKKLDELFLVMNNSPLKFVLKADFSNIEGFNYRFAKGFDIIEVFKILHKLYKYDGGLKSLFEYGYNLEKTVIGSFQAVCDYFYSNVSDKAGMGFYHLIPNPKNAGAMKRMCMFLRWMVREGEVDLGVWDFIPTSELLIPLDVHVARLSREMGLLKRSSNDFKAVFELTQCLKKWDKKDPVRYDFAIFGLGVNLN